MKRNGFTLVEILVAISIMVLVFSFGLVNYLQFRDKQRLVQSVNMVKQAVADAQNAARSGRLFDCSPLRYYKLIFNNGEIIFEIYCAVDPNEIKRYQLSENVYFIPNLQDLYIYPMNGLIDTNSDMNDRESDNYEVILESSTGDQKTLCIDKTGTIIEEACP